MAFQGISNGKAAAGAKRHVAPSEGQVAAQSRRTLATAFLLWTYGDLMVIYGFLWWFNGNLWIFMVIYCNLWVI